MMGTTRKGIIEETTPGAKKMSRAWMASFWEVFTDCAIEMDADYIVTNIRRNTAGSITMTDIAGKSFLDITAEKHRAFVADILEMLKTAAQPFARFHVLSDSGRYYRWTLIAFHKNGEFAGCRGVAVDVTEQTLKEITLNWQRAIIEEGNDYISIADMEGNVLYANPGAFRMTGYDPASGMLPLELIFTESHLNTVSTTGMDKVMKSGSWTGLGELSCLDGTRIPIEHNMFSIRNDKGEAILIATIIRDITVFLEHEKTLETARRAAETANMAKSEFLSRMSHEIRTPMNAILGMINIGMNTKDVERKNYCFTRADSASKHMLCIINDILDMSKIEAEKFDLLYSVFDFEKALKSITNMANVRAEEKKQEFIVDLDYDVPEFIFCDELRLSQVITNLLTNAIKFTPENGTVVLSIKKIEESGEDVTLQIEVSDNGIGISEEQQKRLFMSYNQAHSSISKHYGGTGLGLAISKRIVELMGGAIRVESKIGSGAKFMFTIKTKKVEGKSRAQLYETINLRKARILAVDDSEETRDYFTHVMKALKLEFDVVADGNQAIKMMKDSSDKPFNVFFIDWHMPGMNGIELAKKIKEMNGSSANVIMISASDVDDVKEEAAEAGVEHFISKPLFPSTLINAINTCMGSELYESLDDPQYKTPECPYDFQDNSVLIAEDVDINREVISAILSQTKLSIEYADNGQAAVSMYSANPGKYDLILMDINMPEMDGYEATRQIRALEKEGESEIPIIAMTANVFKEDIEKCLESGMNDHIGKPIDADDLFSQLSKYL